MPKVSVIIPIYNVEKYIERCARSLFEQTLDDIEYIFVNDCSSDSSIDILMDIINEYPQRENAIKIINHAQNLGQSCARRTGMALAQGAYIIHCDADDWVDLDMYEKMYSKAIKLHADAVCCDIVLEFEESNMRLKYNSDFPDHQLMYDCIAPISVQYCSMCNRLISRKIYDDYSIDPFTGVNMWDDVGLSIRFRYFIENSVVINEAFYHYNRKNENSTTRRPIIGRIREQLECVRQLECFFEQEKAHIQYSRFITLLKLVAKSDLFDVDVYLWQRTFPETSKDIFILKCQGYSVQQCLKLYFISRFGVLGIHLMKIMSVFRKMLGNNQ